METAEKSRIHIHFHPRQDGSPWAVEKDLGDGRRGRFLEGVTSGLETDGHGERMTERCIKSFQAQAESGDILLYAGLHGMPYTEDIGILESSWIDEGGDWWTRYRLYDDGDNMGPGTLEAADKVWRMVNGLPPYSSPKEFGFSIEGDIPESGLKFVDTTGKRVMDDIELDGVVLVKRPSYRSSVAHAVAKAIGAPIPGAVRRSLPSSLEEGLKEQEQREAYFDAYYRLQDALDREVKAVMCAAEPDRDEQIRALLDEYAQMMFRLVTENEAVFTDEDEDDDRGAAGVVGLYYGQGDGEEGQDLVSKLSTLKGQLEELVQSRR